MSQRRHHLGRTTRHFTHIYCFELDKTEQRHKKNLTTCALVLIKNNFDFINLKFLCKLTTEEEEEKVCGRCGDHFDDCWVHSAPCYTHWSSFIGTTCPPNSAYPSTHSSPCTHTRLPELTKLFSSLTVTFTMRLLSFWLAKTTEKVHGNGTQPRL